MQIVAITAHTRVHESPRFTNHPHEKTRKDNANKNKQKTKPKRRIMVGSEIMGWRIHKFE